MRKSEFIGIRLTFLERQFLEKVGHQKGLSISGVIRYLIDRAIEIDNSWSQTWYGVVTEEEKYNEINPTP